MAHGPYKSSKKMVTACSRCGTPVSHVISVCVHTSYHKPNRLYVLCKDCLDSFKEWLSNGTGN